MKKILFALALLLTIGAIEASAQSNPPLSNKRIRMKGQAAAPTPDPPTGYYNLWVDSGSGNLYITNSAGTDTPVGAGITGLTDNVIPQANGTTAIENSKMTASGTNSGTWTLYDDTAVTGETTLNLRAGAAQTSGLNHPIIQLLDNGTGVAAGTFPFLFTRSGWDSWVSANYFLDTGPGTTWELSATGLNVGSAFQVNWSSATNYYAGKDLGLAKSSAGILAVTDGSTGQGGIGLSDSATNTVSDALILRHQGGTTVDEFGTGLLFQGENDAGTMHSMASIDAIFTDNADTSEDTRIEMRGHVAGTEYKFASIGDSVGGGIALYDTGGAVRFKYTNGNYQLSVGGDSGAGIRIIGDATNALVFPNVGNIYGDGYEKINFSNPVLQRGSVPTLVDDTATAFITIPVAQGAAVSGIIEYSITFISGGDIETETGELFFAFTNEGGTELGQVSEIGTPLQTPSATMTTDWSISYGTDTVIISVDANSTALTATPTMNYRVRFNSGAGSFTTP